MEQAYNRNQAQNRDQSQLKINEGENTRDQAQNREETQNLDHVLNNDLPDKKKEKKVEDNEILSRQDMVETSQGMIKKFSKKLV